LPEARAPHLDPLPHHDRYRCWSPYQAANSEEEADDSQNRNGSMSDVVVRASGLSKQYRIAVAEAYGTLRDTIMLGLKSFLRQNGGPRVRTEPFWALKDVSFEVRKGEVLGVIGRNGAGKSSLLKILSRIVEPTLGQADIYGRVGSLLEVGTGFHQELTGRENIYLNGAILGMKKAEINAKFDEIVDFAGVEKFLDTPVKHYSSGMYVRLAFAVAAHLEPDILIVDEVLAVGDAGFQQKCLGKMGTVARQGRTVILVSHNMAAIQSLSSRCLWLKNGEVAASGSPRSVVEQYVADVSVRTSSSLAQRTDRQGSGEIRFSDVSLLDAKGEPIEAALSGQDISIAVAYESATAKPISALDVHITFHTLLGQFMFNCSSEVSGYNVDNLPASGQVICHIPELPLAPGQYVFNLYSTIRGAIADWVIDAGHLTVGAGDYFGTGRLRTHEGGFLVKHSWRMGSEGDGV
jgi:lipopolysaccharide transport system ATP-binding protein